MKFWQVLPLKPQGLVVLTTSVQGDGWYIYELKEEA